jgi:DNA ligase 1
MSKSFHPMLAVTSNIDQINLPADQYLCQPKLNGIRAIWDPSTQALYSRNGNRINSVDHIVNQLLDHPYGQYSLDGEIYTGALSFQKLNGLARRKQTTDETAILEYHVFDIAQGDLSSVKRIKLLEQLPETTHIKMVWSDKPMTVNDIHSYYHRYIDQGHEGIILRKKSEKYHQGRSSALIKIKPVQDMEAELIGFADAEDDSKNSGTFGSLILRMKNGIEFRCGGLTDAERHKLWTVKPIGAMVTFKYGAMSDDGTPVFPRYSHLRWDTVNEGKTRIKKEVRTDATAIDVRPRKKRQKVTCFISRAATTAHKINQHGPITPAEAQAMLDILTKHDGSTLTPDLDHQARARVSRMFDKLRFNLGAMATRKEAAQ